MVHASVLQAGQGLIVPSQFAVVDMEIALFQTLASAMKDGWAHSARLRCSARTLSVAVMVRVRKGLVIAMEAGEGTFVTSLPKSAGLVPQAQNVIAPLGLVCAACRLARVKAKAKVSREAVAETAAKVKAKVMVAPPHWEILQAKQMRQLLQQRGQRNKSLI